MKPQHRSFWHLACLAALLLLAAVNQPMAQPAGPNQAPPMPMGQPNINFVAPRSPETVVAHTNQGDLTVKDLVLYFQTGLLPMARFISPDKVPALPQDVLTSTALWVASRQCAYKELQERNDPKLLSELSAGTSKLEDRLIVSHIVHTEIMDETTSPTEADLRDYFAKHPEETKVPFQFTMRHLILMTYEPYVVKDGDTLETIAQRISGDPARAADIRADVPTRPLRREPDKDFKPLIAGEKLLVPMSAQRQEEVRRRLESIRKEATEGKTSFEELAKKYSEAETKGDIIGPLPSGTKPVLGELLEAAKKTPVGQVSPIFQSKHGYQMIQVASKQEEHDRTFEEVRDQIAAKIRQARTEAKAEAVLAKVFSNPAFKINMDVIKQGNKNPGDTVVATVGDQVKVTWKEYSELWGAKGQPQDEEGNRNLLMQLPALQLPLSRLYAEPQMKDPASTLSQQLKVARVVQLGTAYLAHVTDEQLSSQITSDTQNAMYEKHKATEFTEPAKIKASSIDLTLKTEQRTLAGAERQAALDALKKELETALAEVKTPEDFLKKAQTMNEAARSEGVMPFELKDFTPITQVPPGLADAVAKVEAGKWTEPVVTDDGQVMSVLIQEKQPERVKSKDEVMNQVNAMIKREAFAKQLHKVELEYGTKCGFKPAA